MPTYKLVHRARRGDGTTGGKSATVKSEAKEYDCSPKKNSPSASEVVAEMMTSKLPSSSRDGGGGGGGDSEKKKKKKQKLSGPENRSSTANGPGDSILLATSTGTPPPPAGKKSNDDSYDSSDDERSLVFKPPGKVVDLSPLLSSDDSNSTPTLAVKENNNSDSESVVLAHNDSDSESVIWAPPKAIVLTFSGQGQVIDDQTREVCIDDDFDKIQRDLARRSHLPFDAFTLHLDGRVLGSEDTPRSLKLHEVELEYRKIEVLAEQGGG